MGFLRIDENENSIETIAGILEEQRKKIFKPTNEVCEIHEATKVQAGNLEPFCPVCAHEATRKSEEELIAEETKRAYNKDKRWLKEASILIDKTMFAMTFENFKETDEETAANKEKALNIARRLYKGSTSNELLSGRFGTGKTHLAMAILNQLNEHQNKKHLFISIDELLLRIKAGYGGGGAGITEEQALHLISKADVVVIDDLGAEVGSADKQTYASDNTIRIINSILNARISKPTIFTTNLTGKELTATYGGRIKSRIFRGVEKEGIVQFKTTTDKRSNIDI